MSEPDKPKLRVRLKECPLCRHLWERHDENGACREEGCWCLYHPPEEDVELE